MSAEQRRENMPKFSLKEPVEGAKGTRTSGLFEKDNIKSLLKERFENYGKDEENLEIAAEALSNLEPSDDSLWRDPSRVHNIAKGINEQFINKGYVDFRGRKVESPEDVALMMQVCRDPRYETFSLLLVSNGKIVNVTSITSQLPGLTVGIEKDSWSETIKSVSARMKALKADGYYLVHNQLYYTPFSPHDGTNAEPERSSM